MYQWPQVSDNSKKINRSFKKSGKLDKLLEYGDYKGLLKNRGKGRIGNYGP